MGTKNNPGQYDCYEKADADEPMFVLLGRDRCAAAATRAWILYRAMAGETDAAMLKEAFDCSIAMDSYRQAREKGESMSLKSDDELDRLRKERDAALRYAEKIDGLLARLPGPEGATPEDRAELAREFARAALSAVIDTSILEDFQGFNSPEQRDFERLASIAEGWWRRERARQAVEEPRRSIASRGALDILAERKRQVEVEGYDAEHDRNNSVTPTTLGNAAIAYIASSWPPFISENDRPPATWPWPRKWWKPKDRRSNLVRAGALIAASIDRYDALHMHLHNDEETTNG